MRDSSPCCIALAPSPRFIFPPSRKKEAARDLLRCREDIRADLLRARHCLSKFLRHGRRFTGTKKAWSKRHDTWLRAQAWPLPALDQTHRAYLRAVDEAVARLRCFRAWTISPR